MHPEIQDEETTYLSSTPPPISSRCACGKSRRGKIICPPGRDCTALLGKHWVVTVLNKFTFLMFSFGEKCYEVFLKNKIHFLFTLIII